MVDVKRIICKESFNGKYTLTDHIVASHNVPRNDKNFKRFAKLHFSSLEKRADNLTELIALLTLLKSKAMH